MKWICVSRKTDFTAADMNDETRNDDNSFECYSLQRSIEESIATIFAHFQHVGHETEVVGLLSHHLRHLAEPCTKLQYMLKLVHVTYLPDSW